MTQAEKFWTIFCSSLIFEDVSVRARVASLFDTSSKILDHRNFGISGSARFARSAPKNESNVDLKRSQSRLKMNFKNLILFLKEQKEPGSIQPELAVSVSTPSDVSIVSQ